MLMFMNCRQYLGARASPGGNLPLRDRRSHWARGTGGYRGANAAHTSKDTVLSLPVSPAG